VATALRAFTFFLLALFSDARKAKRNPEESAEYKTHNEES